MPVQKGNSPMSQKDPTCIKDWNPENETFWNSKGMANISFFYPDRMKGWALGLNAAGGNIGVSSVQLLTPILMGVGLFNLYQATPVAGVYLQNAGLMWIVPLLVAVFGAIFFMNNL